MEEWDCETVAILNENAILWWSIIDGYEGEWVNG